MKTVLYKVEAYIVPEVNKFPEPTATNENDDIKIASQPQLTDKTLPTCNARNENDASCSSYDESADTKCLAIDNSHCKSVSTQIIVNPTSTRKTVYDKQFDKTNIKHCNNNEDNLYRFDNCLKMLEMEFQTSIRQDAMYPARQFRRVNSLMSIDETNESSEDKLTDLCHHGYRNGCTATIPSPEEVSEEVFKENWLQKIEILRKREAAVIAKETSLQDKERQLFRREREVKIAERMIREKLKQLQRQQQNMQGVENRLEKIGQILGFDAEVIKESHESQSNEFTRAEGLRNVPSSVATTSERIKELDKRPTRNLSQNSSSRNYSFLRKSSAGNTTSGFYSYSSMRYKERPKVSNDDLDSTLSADAGDSSFVRTSERFNPELYKKPYAFTRSASERWTESQRSTAKLQSVVLDKRSEHAIKEDKVLRRLSENICATQSKDTRFQHYGLVDLRLADVKGKTEHKPDNKNCFAHLDLETGNKLDHRKPKDRPTSWDEQANEWLQKKRQAYNLTTKKSAENKENLKCNTVEQKSKLTKKNVKNKILTIFR